MTFRTQKITLNLRLALAAGRKGGPCLSKPTWHCTAGFMGRVNQMPMFRDLYLGILDRPIVSPRRV